MNWMQLILVALFFGLGAVIVPERRVKAWFEGRNSKHRLFFSLAVLIIFVLLGFLLRDIFLQITESALLANIARAFALGIGVSIFFSRNSSEKGRSKNCIDEELCSYVDEGIGKMVLRCFRYPRKRSKEWIVVGDSITFRIVGEEKKDKVSSISNITKTILQISDEICTLKLEIDDDSKYCPIIVVNNVEDIDVARKINDHFLKENPNISHKLKVK
jgi:hypothetical protein